MVVALDERDYEQEVSIGQFLKYLESENQPFKPFTRMAACSFSNFQFYFYFFPNFLGVETFFTQVTLSILIENSGEERT